MGTKERVEILNRKYLSQEDFNDLLKNAKVSVFSYFRTDVGSTTLYTQKYVDEKDKTINELLKRISELEFEVEERDRRIDKAIKYIENHRIGNEYSYEYDLFQRNARTSDLLSILMGSDKE